MSVKNSTNFYYSFFFFLVFANLGDVRSQQRLNIQSQKWPVGIKQALKSIEFDFLNDQTGNVESRKVDRNTVYVKVTYQLKDTVRQNDWSVALRPAFQPSFNWAPHLTPEEGNIIDQHVFRSPVLLAADSRYVLAFIPDLDLLNSKPAGNWYMDMDARNNVIRLGMSQSRVSAHVLFEKVSGSIYPEGKVEFGFYILFSSEKEHLANPFRAPVDFFWKKWGKNLFEKGDPIGHDLDSYVNHTYNWAFHSWKDQVWQEFDINDKKVGAPTFIVNVTQSPNYPGKVNEREFRSVWNQAWFSSLRSASGLYRYARRNNNQDLLQKANLTKELALSFPKKNGFFYGLIGTDMEMVKIDGRDYHRSKGWDHFYWGNSNRNPITGDPRQSPFHILDMSWTAYLMLQWYEELEKDERLLNYAEDYARSLLSIQSETGFFPAWLDLHTLTPLPVLGQSPESSMSVTFLLTLYRITKNEAYRDAALKAMEAVLTEVVEEGRWEDFETYWSCSRIGSTDWVGEKVPRNNMYKQNNFSMFWTAGALLETYLSTGNKKYLRKGQRVMDELLLTQASWQPHYIPVKVLGGFGVLNADGEWNDARQSLFSELIIRYGTELKKKDYIQRGLAAIRASFVMMYCPENPETKVQWEKAWPFFGEEDYGFMMENYGHDGKANKEGLGIGEFTIYDWGNGAAAEAYNRLLDHYGKEFIYNNHKGRKKVY